jgi:hypothetical protein
MTIVRLNSALAAELLLAHVRERSDVTAEPIGPDRIRVSLLGSYRAEAMHLELVLLLRAWEAGVRAKGLEVRLELED